MSNKQKNKIIEIIGWYGPIAFVVSFGLISFEIIKPISYTYQLLNLTGAIAIILISLHKKVYQSVALNGFLFIISLVTLIRMVLGWI